MDEDGNVGQVKGTESAPSYPSLITPCSFSRPGQPSLLHSQWRDSYTNRISHFCVRHLSPSLLFAFFRDTGDPCYISVIIAVWPLPLLLCLWSLIPSAFLLEIIPGDPKLEDYYPQNGRGPGLHSDVSKGHVAPLCSLLNNLGYFRGNCCMAGCPMEETRL